MIVQPRMPTPEPMPGAVGPIIPNSTPSLFILFCSGRKRPTVKLVLSKGHPVKTAPATATPEPNSHRAGDQ